MPSKFENFPKLPELTKRQVSGLLLFELAAGCLIVNSCTENTPLTIDHEISCQVDITWFGDKSLVDTLNETRLKLPGIQTDEDIANIAESLRKQGTQEKPGWEFQWCAVIPRSLVDVDLGTELNNTTFNDMMIINQITPQGTRLETYAIAGQNSLVTPAATPQPQN